MGYNIIYISLIMLFWMMVGQITNYLIGLLVEKKIIERYIKNSDNDFSFSIKKYDMVFIIVVNILPLPSDILTLFLGMIRYDFKKMLIYTLIGRILKFVFLIPLAVLLGL